MSKEIYISSTPHETRLAIVEKDELTEIYYERENEYTLAGSIYNGKVTRVLPGMQSSFVDIGLERDAFLYITDFMEEAGDSADFEGSGRSQRAERPRDNSRSSEGRITEGARPSESSRPREDVRRDDTPAPEAGRSPESGRGRGRRGRGDRDRRRQTTPEAAPVEAAREEFDVPSSVYEAEGDGLGEAETIEVTPAQAGSDELGEGAPGADGSRRWRGRRGRRRGRGGNEATLDSGDLQVTPLRAIDAAAEEEPVANSVPEFAVPEPAAAISFVTTAERSDARPQQGDRDRGRGRRGRDRRDRNRNDRDKPAPVAEAVPEVRHEDRQESVRERFAPRGSRGSDTRAEAAAVVPQAAPEPEPFILPGESLSKYRKGDIQAEADSPKSESIAMARPSTEVQPLAGWDGGSVLPGETLSRRASSTPQAASQPRLEEGSGRNRRRDRDERQGRGRRDERRGETRSENSGRQEFTPRRMEAADAVQPAVTTGHDFEPAAHEFVSEAPAQSESTLRELHASHADEVYEAQTDGVTVEPTHVAEALEEFHETVAEYEPGNDASASYRVDPVPPSEFRQSAVVDEDLVEAEVPAAAVHDVTSLGADGEMHSGFPSAVEHQAHEATGIETGIETGTEDGATADNKHFAPGHGELEEELIDDEEMEAVPSPMAAMQASAHEEIDEEAMAHAADLGSMLREMSIDEMTQAEPAELAEDEEFDIDEEEMEEDELAADENMEPEHAEEAGEPAEGTTATVAGAENGLRRREGGRRGRRDGRRGRDRNAERPAQNTAVRVDEDQERGDEYVAQDDSYQEEPRNGDRTLGDRGFNDRFSSDRSSSDRPSSDRPSNDRVSSDRGSRDRRGMGNGRGRSGGRHSVQAMDLPAISDLLKPGQEVLVQIAKEPIAKKGARITSHIALPGRFLVFMPTVHHTGVSRKIESDGERRRLKEILLSERGDASGGFIVRTAAQGASEEELRSDLRFLLNLWADIKARSESSKSPALIYHDLNLVERILRDQVTDNFSAIWVDTEVEYERVVRFLQRFQPTLVRRVKLYGKDTPLFEQFGITEEINKALRSKVWLKSGGSIVINQTEALVAIDINTGKYVGKTARLEDTIVKTNLDAIPEIVRQIRLRDLGGIIIIDFIDMDERKNRNKVMAALEEELKSDRAPSKVLQFNDFGLVAITRKRVKQSLERTLSTTCGVCAGTGMVKSPVTVCNDIYVEMRKMHKVIEKGDIMLRVNPEVVKQLKTGGAKWLQEMEEMSGKTILVKSDPSLHPEQFDIH